VTQYLEDAGQILVSVVGAGATIDMTDDIPALVKRMAWLLYVVRHEAKGLSNYGAATLIMNDLGDLFSLRCGNASREKILAFLGTEIGNFLTLHRSKRRSRSVRK
jgi:hypothetical protein